MSIRIKSGREALAVAEEQYSMSSMHDNPVNRLLPQFNQSARKRLHPSSFSLDISCIARAKSPNKAVDNVPSGKQAGNREGTEIHEPDPEQDRKALAPLFSIPAWDCT